MSDLQKKIEFAIKLLQSIPNEEPIEISYSGGKDSDVILELARMAGIKYRAIYKDTTIDPPGTLKHCKENGVEIIKPKKSFLQLAEEKGAPNRFRRHCCGYLKEYKVLDRTVQGIRRSESSKRAARYKEPEVCRLYPNGDKTKVYYPILEWTNEDVEEFVRMRGIKCHPLYYDKEGNFHVERRLGCIGCPMAADNGLKDFKRYPKMFKAFLKAQQKYIDTHPKSRCRERYKDAYRFYFFRLFFESKFPTFSKAIEAWQTALTGGMFPELAIDPKAYLEETFGIDLTI